MEDQKKDEAQKEKPKKSSKPSFRLCCTEKMIGSLYDHTRGVRIPAHGRGDVKVEGEVPTRGWLANQIEAGLVMVVED